MAYSKLSILLFLIVALGGFYYNHERILYPIHYKIRFRTIEHPEFIPSAQTVRLTSAWYDNVVADAYWLSAIQYIGSNVISAEYKKYLATMLNLITDINPRFTYAYQIGEILIPGSNKRYENRSEQEENQHIQEAYDLGLKGIRLTCDPQKIEKINQVIELPKLWTDPSLKNPCQDYKIPYFLGYIAFWYKKDAIDSMKYYKITAASEDAPIGVRTIAAIMQGKGGDRLRAIKMFLSLAETVDPEKATTCADFAGKLGSMIDELVSETHEIASRELRQIEQFRATIVDELKENINDPVLADTQCSTYLNKSVREMNLSYLENADKRYREKFWKSALRPSYLKKEGFIDYIPIDYQKGEEQGERVIYYYNTDNNLWDTKMATLDEQ